ncbi:methionine synthase [Myxococcus llanfairpwllgwyngyllgogerychwyrndrobwllllantysiliogogogochensis]|uniref:Methionine synthase n=1 Tax=Myxococcus llanfairpwllgwyngyllgogerychwyrndrobwllllantysiliogogogochensis TaxID=2590453 RepID=A0A540WM31_9BACT|nr:methionine synthase [Myxococcus llanfairpwllgwyngyllgogerychwyrndrobwllllantysiliogogogochensis]TQF10083.1 methionine synthase [Myxococcus llanfairpwllgwyngyllgogerychwyrndrobwllllantysiliogogogochensis]
MTSPTALPPPSGENGRRVEALRTAMRERVLVLDGAMGTLLQQLDLKAADFGGAEFEGCNENLVLTRPEIIRDIHARYFAAGADVTETDSFGGTPVVLNEFGLGHKALEINAASARLAREAAAEAEAKDGRMRWVAGSVGPTTKAISVTGGITFEELVENFAVQAEGLALGGSDYLLVETAQDTRNVKAALLGIDRAFRKLGYSLPVAVSGTIEPMGTMLAGQSVESLATSLEHVELLYLGLNCATGPDFMTDHLRSLAALSPFPVSCVPNAGLPDENGNYLETPEMLARSLTRFCEQGWLNVVGGCCGTQEGHIRALSQAVKGLKPRASTPKPRSTLSGVDYLEVTDEMRPVIVGERTNVIGSKKFKELIVAGQLEDASEIARAQVKRGAQIIDICLANPDREELEDMREFLEVVIKKVRVPLMIDSTDERVIEMALTYSQGKAIINSVNLEDGEERFEKVVPLARRFGAALVVGCIDEIGMAVTRQRKLEVAERSFELLTKKYGMKAEDLYFDPLVFPCASGDAQYTGSGVETVEGVRLIKQRFPQCRSVLGISNVSFGLPTAGREVLNSVFLYHCVQAGLDMALVNSEKLERYASLPEEERKLAEDLLYNRGTDPVTPFAAHFRERKPPKVQVSTLPLEERLQRYIIEGSRDGLFADLEAAMAKYAPLDIINGPLMKGMDEVGRLFAANELIVAEVLQSAESMKAAVTFLEPHMSAAQAAMRGKIVLATVKGDVHDIGKNLVEIILANNGFQVVNLGIKVPPEQLVQAVREHKPDIVGLSGLLVKSAHQMVATAEDLKRAGVSVPILVGGAALSRNFVDRNIAPAYGGGTVAYAQDAMSGLDLAKQIVDPSSHEKLRGELSERRVKLAQEVKERPRVEAQTSRARSAEIRILDTVPSAPDWERHVLTNTPLDHIWRFINPVMLYGRHLGLRTSSRALGTPAEAELAKTEEGRKALALKEAVEELKGMLRGGLMQARAVFQFFKAGSDGNRVVLFDGSTGKEAASFDFPRQDREGGLCLADYLRPLERGVPTDNVAMFVVTAGSGIRELSEGMKAKGEFLKMHAVQALALETAEGYAELLHTQLRSMWGTPDKPDMTMLERFRAEYAGKRYSFGYPACPRLEDQSKLFTALRPEDIGVQLTDGCMMEPEASVSALVFHHQQASYFSVT